MSPFRLLALHDTDRYHDFKMFFYARVLCQAHFSYSGGDRMSVCLSITRNLS